MPTWASRPSRDVSRERYEIARIALARRRLQEHAHAFAYGADAVHAGQPRYSLRVRNSAFDLANLRRDIAYAHARGKALYAASNITLQVVKVNGF